MGWHSNRSPHSSWTVSESLFSIHTCSNSVMANLPPGIIYLIHCIPQILIGPISTYLLLKLSQTFYRTFQLSASVTIILLISSGPVIFAIILVWNDFKNYRAARAVGAVLPPRILDYSPGNIYSIWKEIKLENTGYFGATFFPPFIWYRYLYLFYSISGEGFEDQAENSGGFSFNLRFLFKNRVNLLLVQTYRVIKCMHPLDGHGRTWTHQGFWNFTFILFSIIKTCIYILLGNTRHSIRKFWKR